MSVHRHRVYRTETRPFPGPVAPHRGRGFGGRHA